jgi:general secretion pathway protein K
MNTRTSDQTISHYRSSRRPAKAEHGVALLVVLLLVAVLTLLATGAAGLSLLHRRAAQAVEDAVRTDTAADSAIRVVLLQLAGRGQMWATWLDGSSRTVGIAGLTADVKVELEGGRIDLNTGNRELLYALFVANGWSRTDARAFVARIEDWIAPADELRADEGGLRQLHEARNAPFENVAELRQVADGDQVSQELLDALTVYTHAKYPLQSAAPPAVQRALAWADQRRLGDRRWVVNVPQSPGTADSSAVGRLVRVHACATYSRGRRCRGAVVRLTGDDRNPFEIFLWQSDAEGQ